MFRRGRGMMRRSRPRKKAIQHFTCSLANLVGATGAVNLNCANAGAFNIVGLDESIPRDALSNKQQEVTIGSQIGRTTFDIGVRLATQTGIIEYAVYKIERSTAIPAIGALNLPSAADINTGGMQCEMRSHNPGRIMDFGLLAYTAETTRTKKLIINWKKFNLATIRQGDFYGIVFFNRGGAAVTIDVYCRFKEWI